MMMLVFWLEKPTKIDENQFVAVAKRIFQKNVLGQEEKVTENQIETRFAGQMHASFA